MPIKRGEDNKGPYYQWGSHKKYHYKPGNTQSRTRAYNKAVAQAQAAYSSGYKGK